MNAPSSSVAAATTTTTVEAAVAESVLMTVAVDQKIKNNKKKARRRMFLKEWSLAPSIFNIKARGVAHCIYWMKLTSNEVYKINF